MINVHICVQTVLHLQPQMLEVSFATLQLRYVMVQLVPLLSNPAL